MPREKHSEPAFYCNRCGREFNRKLSLGLHMRSCMEIKSGDSNSLCKWCNQNFTDASSLVQHEWSAHKQGYISYFMKQGLRNIHDRTCSLNNFLLCQHCDRKFYTRGSISAHLKRCMNITMVDPKDDITMMSLDLKSQEYQSIASRKFNPVKCDVCSEPFHAFRQLRFHIRRHHFNLKSKLPYCLQKKVNQVWFENVLNCNNVMEIKKTGPNKLVMRKLDEKTAIKVIDNQTEEVDVTHLYPVWNKSRKKKIKCEICLNIYASIYFKRHMKTAHNMVVSRKIHHCSKCNMNFRKRFRFLRHNCHN